MENYEEILINYFASRWKETREKEILLIEQRDFEALRDSNWTKKTRVEEIINERDVQQIIDRLQLALKNIAPNQTIPFIGTNVFQEEGQWAEEDAEICLISYIFTIKPIEACERSAYHHTQSCLWKIKNQPNGKDTKRYLEIISNSQSKT